MVCPVEQNGRSGNQELTAETMKRFAEDLIDTLGCERLLLAAFPERSGRFAILASYFYTCVVSASLDAREALKQHMQHQLPCSSITLHLVHSTSPPPLDSAADFLRVLLQGLVGCRAAVQG